MCLAQGPQRSDTGEAQTRGPSARVKHSNTKPLCSYLCMCKNFKICFSKILFLNILFVLPPCSGKQKATNLHHLVR